MNILTIPPGHDVASLTVAHVLKTMAPSALPRAVLLVPNRRAAISLRDAFRIASGGKPLLLPCIVPLANLSDELLLLLGTKVLSDITALPSAMPEWQRLCLLVEQVRLFEKHRYDDETFRTSLEQALRLASDLGALQDRFTRYEQPLTMDRLRGLVTGDPARHWEQSISFLKIVAEIWPAIETEYGMITEEARQIAAIKLLGKTWKATPPDYPVMMVGSTASQPATADLMHIVAELPHGSVILPGLDGEEEWPEVHNGHPYFHLKTFLDRWNWAPSQTKVLAEPTASIWLSVLGNIDDWRTAKPTKKDWGHIRLIPCRHVEEETQVITLLMREAAESPDKRIALITPDEGLMARVAVQLTRYDIQVDRLAAGTLATTQTGSLFQALMEAIASPERALPLLNLLRHALVALSDKPSWQRWLAIAEPKFRGIVSTRPGTLPHLPESLHTHPATAKAAALVRGLAELSRSRLIASAWVKKLTTLLAPAVPESGSGQEAVEEALDALAAADLLGPLDADGFASLLHRQLDVPWRGPILNAHPNLFLLTPVEARLMQFDRVILANMQDKLWPGLSQPGPWLNFSQQQALGLPGPEEQTALMAHDVLMLGGAPEVFLTWPNRDAGSPTTRSPFIERLVAFLALHGVEESELEARQYLDWAVEIFAPVEFKPATPAAPCPPTLQRPREVRVTALDRLFSDPYSIYAEYVLKLKPLQDIDAELEPKDFGTLAHSAIAELTAHWNMEKRAADEPILHRIADAALRSFSDRPNVKLFWRNRLLKALRFVNEAEVERRKLATRVSGEVKISQTLALFNSPLEGESTRLLGRGGGGMGHEEDNPPRICEVQIPLPLKGGAKTELALHGRIDRLEEGADGVTITDYKTGAAPKEKDVLEGKSVQLLAYALMLAEEGKTVASLDYWELPHAGKPGSIRALPMDGDIVEHQLGPLRAALTAMCDEKTPFLARPLNANDRIENDYDGISRFDEWAG